MGPSWLGDMIMAQALFKVLKAKFACVIDVVAPEWSLPIVACMSEVNTSITMPAAGHGELALRKRYALAKQLRTAQYDQAIVLTNTWKSALIPFWAKIPNRTGWLGEFRFGLLNDVRYLNQKQLPTMMQRYVALGYDKNAELPIDHPYPSLKTDQATVLATLKKFDLVTGHKKIMALCPGAAFGPAKCWPAPYFAQVAQAKIAAGWEVWLFGSKQDEPIIDNIKGQLPRGCRSFAGKLQLAETVDLMSVVDVVISNDSGLMHLASSLNKYLLAIYGSTSPGFTPPFGQQAKIVIENLACSPCFKKTCPLQHHQCMNAITAERILTLLSKDGW